MSHNHLFYHWTVAEVLNEVKKLREDGKNVGVEVYVDGTDWTIDYIGNWVGDEDIIVPRNEE